jgi:hypothetical protein
VKNEVDCCNFEGDIPVSQHILNWDDRLWRLGESRRQDLSDSSMKSRHVRDEGDAQENFEEYPRRKSSLNK